MDRSTFNFDDPADIAPLDAILNDLAEDLDGSPSTLHDLLQICRADLGDENIQNITTAMQYFKCVENNVMYDQIEFVDYLINVTDVLNYHTVMGTNRVSDQFASYKEKLLIHKEHLRRTGVNTDKNFEGRMEDREKIIKVLSDCVGISFVGKYFVNLDGNLCKYFVTTKTERVQCSKKVSQIIDQVSSACYLPVDIFIS